MERSGNQSDGPPKPMNGREQKLAAQTIRGASGRRVMSEADQQLAEMKGRALRPAPVLGVSARRPMSRRPYPLRTDELDPLATAGETTAAA